MSQERKIGSAKVPVPTAWGHVARWYHDLVRQENAQSQQTYQRAVILPNLLRLVAACPGETLLDLACGDGWFAKAVATARIRVLGVDAARELISLARTRAPEGATFAIAKAERLAFLTDESIDKIVCILAIQNISDVLGAFGECRRVLRPNGRLFLVMNHPAFRIPKGSSWGWDPSSGTQYRRIDRYLCPFASEIQMHPGGDTSVTTKSFHRPLEFYVKALKKCGFGITDLEEWISHRVSQRGPKAVAEDRARREFPLFLMLEARALP